MNRTRSLASTIFCSIVVFTASGVARAQPLDEPGYVRAVVNESEAARLIAAEADAESAEAAGLGLWPNPSVDWQRESLGAGTGPSGGTQDNFVLTVPLVVSGRTFLEAQARDLHQEAAELRSSHRRALLIHDATLRFRRAAAAHQRVETVRASLSVLKELYGVVAAREKAGEASGYDLLRIGLEAAVIESEVTDAEVFERAARAEAAALLGGDVELSLEGTAQPAHGEVTDTLEVARADVKALELDIKSADAAVRAAARGFIPELTVTGGAQAFRLGLDQSSWGYVVGVSLPLPLFQRGQDKAEQARARKSLNERRHALRVREVRLRLDAAVAELAARAQQMKRHQTQVVKRAAELRKVARASYQGGAADLLVLVDAERAWREAQLQAAELDLQLLRAQLDIALISGRLGAANEGVSVP